jgi:hypothetical protein
MMEETLWLLWPTISPRGLPVNPISPSLCRPNFCAQELSNPTFGLPRFMAEMSNEDRREHVANGHLDVDPEAFTPDNSMAFCIEVNDNRKDP